jgi:hypothetical protein
MSADSWVNVESPFLGNRVTNFVALTSEAAAFYRVVTLPQPLIVDPSGNLTGDSTRGFMDIVACTALAEGTNYVFMVQAAAPMPDPSVMTDKRFDFIFFIDADWNLNTGQGPAGNDCNVHLFLQADRWGAYWAKVTPASENDGVVIDYSKFQFGINGDTAALVLPAYFLPSTSFEIWMVSHNGITPDWIPSTEHPSTARSVFEF